MRYTLDIAGTQYEFIRLEFGRKVGIESQPFSALCKIAGARLPAIGNVVTIDKEINNTILNKYQGKVEAVQHIPTKEGVVKVAGFDKARKINYVKVANLGYNNTKGSTILDSEILPSTTTDLTKGTFDITDVAINTVNFGKSIGADDSALFRSDAFKIIEMFSDRDIYIKRDGTTDFTNGAGTNRSATHVMHHGINCELSPDIGFTEDETRRVKQVIVKGQGVGNIFKIGSAGAPAAADKIRQIELPFVQNNTDADTVASNLLSELDQTYKYAKLTLNDLFTTNYDIFDTVKLKANLPTKTINENLKVYSIHTVVTHGGSVFYETQEIQLANFRRAVWAPLVAPIDVASANANTIRFNSISTQAQAQVLAAGGSSFFAENQVTTANVFVDTTESTIATFAALANSDIASVWVQLGLRITSQVFGNGDGVLQIRISDGTNFWPTGGVYYILFYNPFVAKRSFNTLTILIPENLKNKTLTVKGKTVSGRIRLNAAPYLASIAEHTH